MRPEIKRIKELFKKSDSKIIRLQNPITLEKETKFVYHPSYDTARIRYSARTMTIGSLIYTTEAILIGSVNGNRLYCERFYIYVTECSTDLLKRICNELPKA